MGSILFMLLIGLIIASVVNMFLKNDTMMWILTYVGIVIFGWPYCLRYAKA